MTPEAWRQARDLFEQIERAPYFRACIDNHRVERRLGGVQGGCSLRSVPGVVRVAERPQIGRAHV